MQKVLSYLRGYVLVRFAGKDIEATLMKLSRNGIFIWDIRQENSYMSGKISCQDFLRIRAVLAGRKRCQIRLLKKKGLPFVIKYCRNRLGLIVGIALFFIFLSVAGRYVWAIDLYGNVAIDSDRLLNNLFEIGIHTGQAKNRLDLGFIEQEILRNNPQISWVDAHIVGTRLQLKIVEKVFLPEEGLPHVFASADGIIEEIIVLKGRPIVKEGDTVKKGEVLIESSQGRKAAGIVRARVWYEAHGEAKILCEERRLTGKKIQRLTLYLDGEKFLAWGVADIPFPYYTLEETTKVVPFGGFKVVIQVFREEERFARYISAEAARYIARDECMRNILADLPLESEIIKISTTETRALNGLVRTRLLVEVKQDIGERGGVNNIEAERDYDFTDQ